MAYPPTPAGLRASIRAAVASMPDGIDVDAVADEIHDRFHTYDIDAVPSVDVWHIVDRHDMSDDVARTARVVREAEEYAEAARVHLRAAVRAAAADGRSEVELARTSGATRTTVRKWVGK